MEHHQAKTLQVTVYQDQRTGAATTSDLSMEAILAAVDKACAIASYAGQDPYAGLAEPQFLAENYPDLQLYHHWDITPAQAIDIAIECDTVAREQDPRITDAEGSSVSTYDSFKMYGNTHGFIGCYPQSLQTISCGVVAQSGEKMQRDHEYTTARSAADLDDPVMMAKQAAQKVLQRLDTRRLTTRRCPVIFHAPLAKGLLSILSARSVAEIFIKKPHFYWIIWAKRFFPNSFIFTKSRILLAAWAALRLIWKGSERGTWIMLKTVFCKVTC